MLLKILLYFLSVCDCIEISIIFRNWRVDWEFCHISSEQTKQCHDKENTFFRWNCRIAEQAKFSMWASKLNGWFSQLRCSCKNWRVWAVKICALSWMCKVNSWLAALFTSKCLGFSFWVTQFFSITNDLGLSCQKKKKKPLHKDACFWWRKIF